MHGGRKDDVKDALVTNHDGKFQDFFTLVKVAIQIQNSQLERRQKPKRLTSNTYLLGWSHSAYPYCPSTTSSHAPSPRPSM